MLLKRTGISAIPLMERCSGWSVASSRSGRRRSEPFEHGVQLEPGEAGAEAEVGAEAEREVVVRRTLDVEAVRLVELRFVEVRRLVQEQNLVAGAEPLALELDVAGDRAVHVLDRRDPAQHLFDGGGEQPEVVQQPFLLARVRQELFHPATRDVTGGLVASDEQQQRLEHDLVLVEAVTVDLRVHEHADEVVGRFRTPIRDHAASRTRRTPRSRRRPPQAVRDRRSAS